MKRILKPVMLGGTGSDVGKSILTAGLCRIFKQDGYRPAPFKAQNMALNSYVTPEGLELGRAQAVQAEAAGMECKSEMNPILLKPQNDLTAQVVLNGKVVGNKDAYDYFHKGNKEIFRKAACSAFDRLKAEFNPVVMEGAGSIAEMNLMNTDIVNMPMARYADAAVILVADIDRGGVFASVYGSIMLQSEEDRERIKGIIINKFRGDERLFDDGRKLLEKICGVPVLGVIPYFKDIHIEDEDSVSLLKKNRNHTDDHKINVAVVALRHLSNFTDFDTIARDERVHLYFTDDPRELKKADMIILPGSKNTIDDLRQLKANGCAEAIINAADRGTGVLGICGGYQMMGKIIKDPTGIEGNTTEEEGLGLLNTVTILKGEKTVKRVEFGITGCEGKFQGYEIHNGITDIKDNSEQFIMFPDGSSDGCRNGKNIMGCYIHGFLDDPVVIDYILWPFAYKKGLSTRSCMESYKSYKERQYNALADKLRMHLDMDKLYAILREDD